MEPIIFMWLAMTIVEKETQCSIKTNIPPKKFHKTDIFPKKIQKKFPKKNPRIKFQRKY